jgi:hypothetical protein
VGRIERGVGTTANPFRAHYLASDPSLLLALSWISGSCKLWELEMTGASQFHLRIDNNI